MFYRYLLAIFLMVGLTFQPLEAQASITEIFTPTAVIAIIILIGTVVAMVLMLVSLRKQQATLQSPEEEAVKEAYLQDIDGVTKHKNFALGNKPTMLGRVAGKDGKYYNYFVIPKESVGRRHSVIQYKESSYWIVDEGSVNGTFVNGIAATSEIQLKDGDVIRLHKLKFKFVMPEKSA